MMSLKGDYRVYDESENEVYRAEGQTFSMSNKYIFQDSNGETIFEFRQKVLSLKPTFFITRDGQDILKIQKTFGFKPEIFVEYLLDTDAFYVSGNIWGSEYKFFKEGREFAYVAKDIWKLADTYGVAVEEGQDATIVLAVVVIIQIIKDADQGA